MIPQPLFTTRAPWVFAATSNSSASASSSPSSSSSAKNKQSNKIDIYSFSPYNPASQQLAASQSLIGRDDIPLLAVYRGVFLQSQRLSFRLQPSSASQTSPTRFSEDYSFQFELSNFSNPQTQFVLRGQTPGEGSPPLDTQAIFTLNSGDTHYDLEVAASMALAPGLYRAEFKKTTSNPLFQVDAVSPLPVIWLHVRKTVCYPLANTNQFYLPVDGVSLAVVFDMSDCLPAQNIIITASLPEDYLGLMWFHGPSAVVLGRDNNVRTAGFYVRANASGLTLGDIVNCTFKITGSNAEVFQFSSLPYFVKFFTVTKLVANVTASPLVKHPDYAASSSIELVMQCSQPAQAFWLFAANEINNIATTGGGGTTTPSLSQLFKTSITHQTMLLATTLNDMVSSVSVPQVLFSNVYKSYIQPQTQQQQSSSSSTSTSSTSNSNYDSLLYRQHGMLQGMVANQALQLTVSGLRHGDKYSFAYFCRGQNEGLSEIKFDKFALGDDGSVQPSMLNYTRLTFFFNTTISSAQQNALLCQLHQFFVLNSFCVAPASCVICNHTWASSYTRRKPPFVPVVQSAVTQARNCTPNNTQNSTDTVPVEEQGQKEPPIDPKWVPLHFYFWPTVNSDLQTEDVSTVIENTLQKSLDEDGGCLFQDIVNATEDLDVIAAFRGRAQVFSETLPFEKQFPGLEIVEMRRTPDSAVLGLKLVNVSQTTQAFVFAAVHEYAVNETMLIYQPNAAQVRRRQLGNGKTINFDYQMRVLNGTEQTTFVFQKLTIGKKYNIYWTAVGLDECLSNYYSALGYNEFEFNGKDEVLVYGKVLQSIAARTIMLLFALFALLYQFKCY